MKYLSVFILAITTIAGYGQQWNFNSNIGYATGEARSYKKIMLTTENLIGYEKSIGNEFYLFIAAGVNSLRFSHEDTGQVSVFTNRYSFVLPISVRKYYFLSRNAKGYIDLALYGNYVFNEKNEYRSPTMKVSGNKNNLGYNAGVGLRIGYKISLSKTLFFDISCNAQIDYINEYKNEADQLKTNKRLIGMGFYKKFRK